MAAIYKYSGRLVVSAAVLIGVLFFSAARCWAVLEFTGVNLSGAEFGVRNNDVHLPGAFGTDYTYPTNAETNYYVNKGANAFRLPIRWERLQQSQNAALDATELARIDSYVFFATLKNAYTIIDPHNFERYYPATNNFQSSAQGLVGSAGVPDSSFADFWSKVADHYKSNSHVIFNLMNEPNAMSTEQLVTSENAAIAAIRATGATNLILVPGNAFTGAWTWADSSESQAGVQMTYGTLNSVAMLNIVDSGNNFAFDVHQYLDSNGSGTSTQIGTNAVPNDPTIGATRLAAVTQWLHTNNRKGFLGEFAVANTTIGTAATQVGDEAINNMLGYMEANSDVWLGWNWWGGGPWWGDYMFSIEPDFTQSPPADKAVMSVVQPHFAHTVTGDYNGDGLVNIDDYTVWQNTFGQTGAGLAADANHNGIVDAADYTVWRDHATLGGGGAFAQGAVPEPSALLLLVVGAAGVGVLRRGRR